MKNTIVILCCIYIQFAAFLTGTAQVIELKPAPSNIAIDGNLSEWENQLPFADKKNTFSYLISNDRNNLYLIIKTKDAACQANILGSGISFSLNTTNAKDYPTVTYPVRGKEDPSEYMNLDSEQIAMKTILARYKRIKVQNFKDIKAEQLSTANPYGLKVALGYAEDAYMIYEEAIPLALLSPDGTNEMYSYSIKINGLARKVFFVGSGTIVPGRSADPGTKEDQIAYYIQVNLRGDLRLNGPMPTGDYDDMLTADTEMKGEFILAK